MSISLPIILASHHEMVKVLKLANTSLEKNCTGKKKS